MRIIVDQQCDVTIEGRRKALFVGQRYEIEDGQAEQLIGSGHVRVYREAGEAFVSGMTRPKAKR